VAPVTPPVVLTIAGSDSGAGAGIQADLKVFAALGLYGTSAITAITAQNTREVRAVHSMPAELVTAQLDAVLADLPVCAVKTGMLGTEQVADAVAAHARAGLLPNLVVDPVLVSTSGHRLGVVAAVERLLPYALVATPNRAEAAALVGRPVSTPDEMAAAAGEIAAGGPRYVIVTGGDDGFDHNSASAPQGGAPGRMRVVDHNAASAPQGGAPGRMRVVDHNAASAPQGGAPGRMRVATGATESVDVFWTGTGVSLLRGPRVATRNTHGTGCSFSAAIAARLGLGDSVPDAVRFAKEYVAHALAGARDWRLGGGHGPLDHFGWSG
jgi:hydroxymethylpyrimidine/phosphomethylpyrimidine kinase